MKTNIFKLRTGVIALIIVVFTISIGKLSAQALDCNTINNRVWREIIRQKLNIELAEYDTKRKKLRIDEIESINCNGSQAIMVAKVTMKRKIRRDAKGTMEVIAKAEFNVDETCFKDPKVFKLNLNNTLERGERFYKRRLNKKIPDGICLSR